MGQTIDLADPSFEPTDEQLIELSKRAFAEVPHARERAQRELRARIATGRQKALDEFEKRRAARKGT